MKLTRDQLESLVLKVAAERFGDKAFNRRPLMDLVERRVRQLGLWEAEDNQLSGSAGTKSRGLANIDRAISNLKGIGLDHIGRDRWRLSESTRSVLLPSD